MLPVCRKSTSWLAAMTAADIPVVVLAAIALITLFDVQLEQISLASIIIALGLLVDNAVQVCDQARTNQIAGMAPFPAAVEGANTLAIPMLVGTTALTDAHRELEEVVGGAVELRDRAMQLLSDGDGSGGDISVANAALHPRSLTMLTSCALGG